MKHLVLFVLLVAAINVYSQQSPHKYNVGDTAFCGIVFYEKMDTLCTFFTTYMRDFSARMDTINSHDLSAGFIFNRDTIFFTDTFSCNGKSTRDKVITDIYYRDTSVTIYATYDLYNISSKIFKYGQHGLVCSMADQQTSAPWDTGYLATYAFNDILFDRSNAERIVSKLGGYSYAALIARKFIPNDSNCINWYLPSRSELRLMYGNLAIKGRGNFAKEGYWSSVENLDSSVYTRDTLGSSRNVYKRGENLRYRNTTERKAWLVDFFDGKTFTADKINKYHVRAIREFWIPY
jgi:hypothetical protein